jgi:hypothetical protein
MQNLLSALLAATPAPTETTDPAATFYSPGVQGFIMTFIVVVAAVALIFDMVRRVRKVRYRADITAKLDAESAEQAADAKPAATKPAATAKPASSAKPAAAKPKASSTRPKPDRPAAPPKPKRD